MSIQKIVQVKNNQLVIELPESFKGKEKVLVTVDDLFDSKQEKIQLLQKAAKDPLFLNDIKEINEDFGQIDTNFYDH